MFSPAPPGPYSTNLSPFNGDPPNGEWRLYIVHDNAGTQSNGFVLGWSLRIATTTNTITGAGAFEFNGGTLITRGAVISNSASFVVGRPGGVPAVWDVRAGGNQHSVSEDLYVGRNSSFNQLLITNGALLECENVVIGGTGDSNTVWVTGANSIWNIRKALAIGYGYGARGNSLVVSSGASVRCKPFLTVGAYNPNNRLEVKNGASVAVDEFLYVGSGNGATNSRVVVDGGALYVTNQTANALFDLDQGTNVLDAGWMEVDRLRVLGSGVFEFNGGTLKCRAINHDNGRIFTVGNGTSIATLHLAGGTNRFTTSAFIANHATLTGTGAIAGTVAVSSGGMLLPGDSIGKLVLSNTPSLGGTVFMEILKNGGTRDFDQIQVTAALIYGGALTVSNIGAQAFAVGDNFKLFNATSFVGSFSPLNLPPLNPGLGWTNKLTVDGSIEVISQSQPGFASVTRSGTNLVFTGTNGTAGQTYAVLTATNVTTPAANWQSLMTNQFSAGGQFSFTNGINRNERQRYFRLRTP
jgi:hypothetical protein